MVCSTLNIARGVGGWREGLGRLAVSFSGKTISYMKKSLKRICNPSKILFVDLFFGSNGVKIALVVCFITLQNVLKNYQLGINILFRPNAVTLQEFLPPAYFLNIQICFEQSFEHPYFRTVPFFWWFINALLFSSAAKR